MNGTIWNPKANLKPNMARKQKKPEKEPNHERWLLTYADLITLLMIFFVVMYAMSSVDVVKFKAMSQSLRMEFGGGANLVGDQTATNIIPPAQSYPEEMHNAHEQVSDYLNQQGLGDWVSSEMDENNLKISIEESLLFQPGKSDLTAAGHAKLLEITAFLVGMTNPVRISLTADGALTQDRGFPTTWHLAAQRAANIAQVMVDEGSISVNRLSPQILGRLAPPAPAAAPPRRVRLIVDVFSDHPQ